MTTAIETALVALCWLTQAPGSPPSTQDLAKQFEQSIAADKAAGADQAAAPNPAPEATAPAPTGPPRAGSLLNPEISVIGTFAVTHARDNVAPAFVSGDDPAQQGFSAQEVELGFAADVDPYLVMRAFLTIPNLEGLEVEEAFLATTGLPANLLLKAGVFRSALGRNNEQHLHLQDFARRPKLTALFGADGLRAPGAQLSVLLPLPWFATLYAEAFSLTPSGTYGRKLSATAILEQFFELSSTWSLLVGANAASLARGPEEGDMATNPEVPPRSTLVGGDVYLKWQPLNERDTYFWIAFTGEWFAARPELDGATFQQAGYGQLVAQVARRFRVGGRLDLVGDGLESALSPGSHVTPSASVAFLPSEFSRLRLTGSWERNASDPARANPTVTLQFEAAIGAHGAHPF